MDNLRSAFALGMDMVVYFHNLFVVTVTHYCNICNGAESIFYSISISTVSISSFIQVEVY